MFLLVCAEQVLVKQYKLNGHKTLNQPSVLSQTSVSLTFLIIMHVTYYACLA